MNTIKFRIWNPEEKKMVESGATPMMLHSFFEYTARFNTQYKMPYQQFTGLVDKQGKEIYEGDILKSAGIVSWNKVEAKWSCIDIEWNDKREWHDMLYLTTPLEVIGNIYENPELIK